MIALADLLKESSGLPPNRALLGLSLPEQSAETIDGALEVLRARSLIVHRRFSDTWAVFEGSDFDIEGAVGQALLETEGSVGRCARRVGQPTVTGRETPLPQNGRAALVRGRYQSARVRRGGCGRGASQRRDWPIRARDPGAGRVDSECPGASA